MRNEESGMIDWIADLGLRIADWGCFFDLRLRISASGRFLGCHCFAFDLALGQNKS